MTLFLQYVQNKLLLTWNQEQTQEAHFEGESGSGMALDRRALNLLHVAEKQSYP
jgi:hypothetical protein